jgi:Signal transduction histidine kinase
MKIRTRIFASNTAMVLMGLVVLVAVSSTLLSAFAPRYNQAARRVIGEEVFKVEGYLKALPDEKIDFEKLRSDLAPYRYAPVVLKGDEVVYSAADENVLAWVRDWVSTGGPVRENHSMMLMEDATILRAAKMIDGEEYTILAPLEGSRPTIREQTPFAHFQRDFVIVCIAVVAGLLVLSQLFTRILSKRIMTPVDALTAAAHRVSAGDYETPIVYKGDREFEAVCDAFNQMQVALKKEKEKTAAYETAREDMVASISHDLRTPLTSIKGYIKGLTDGVAQTREKQEAYLKIAYQKACEMDGLLSKLFYFSKMETGGLPMNFAKMDIGKFVTQFAKETALEWQDKQSEITAKAEENLEVKMDAEQMKRVLNNLADNALKYGNVQPLQISIRVLREGEAAVLIFSDNGKAVPDKQLPHLFDRFFRGDEARGRQRGNGSGLGLYIVKYIVKGHGGTVEARNDGGLSIRITLPLIGGESA